MLASKKSAPAPAGRALLLAVELLDDQHPPDDRAGAGQHPGRQPALGGEPRPRPLPPSQGDAAVLRHPAGNAVLEVWPEPGWYTEIIAPLVRDQGKYYAARHRARPDRARSSSSGSRPIGKSWPTDPTLYGECEIVTFPTDGSDVVPPGSIDMVVTFRNIHNWMARDTAPQAFATLYQGAQARWRARSRRAPWQSGSPAGPEGQERLCERGIRDPAHRGAGVPARRRVRRSTPTRRIRRTTSRACGRCRRPTGWGTRIGRSTRDIGESDRFTLKFVKPKRSVRRACAGGAERSATLTTSLSSAR